jgi:multidrug efflux system membrane fusion protein
VEFAVPQDHASWLQHNAGAFMDVKAFDRTRTTLLDTGVFASLDNQIDTQTGTVRAKARFNNARQQLFPSQFVNVQLKVRTIEGAVVVPVTAVRQGGQGDFVFVVQQDRTVKMRPVVRGQTLEDRVQIVSGLQVGERVVTEGADRLRDGSRVTLPGDAPRTPGAGGGRGRRDGAAGGPRDAAPGALPAAPDPLGPASAARGATPPQREATAPWAPASAMMGSRRASGAAGAAPAAGADASPGPAGGEAPGGRRQNLTPEERAARAAEFQKLTPEEREERRRQRQARRAEQQAQ